jgi:hypothetical protein
MRYIQTHKGKAILVATVALSVFALLTQAIAQDVLASITSMPSAAASEKTDLRLAIDKVRLDIDTGNIADADETMKQLSQSLPDDPEVLAMQSDLNLVQDNRGMAYANASAPGVPNADERQTDALLSPQGPSISGGYDMRKTNEAIEQMYGVEAHTEIDQGLALTLKLQNDHVNTRETFLRSNGSLQSFYGNRQQGSATLDKMFDDGQELLGTIYALQNKAGVGLEYSLWDSWGATSIIADFNKPNSDYVEMVVEHGVKHDVTLERKFNVDQFLQAKATGGFNSYALDGVTDAAEAAAWTADIDYVRPVNLFDGELTEGKLGDLTLGLHYNGLAEYFSHINHRIDLTGSVFTPLRANSYEVHAFTGSVSKNILPDLTAEISGGEGFNRIQGNRGPIYAAVMKYAITDGVALDVHASRNLVGGQNNSEKEDTLGMGVRWNY